MSRRAAAVQAEAQPSVLAPWLELLRPRVASMVTLMALLGAATAPGSTFPRALEAALLMGAGPTIHIVLSLMYSKNSG